MKGPKLPSGYSQGSDRLVEDTSSMSGKVVAAPGISLNCAGVAVWVEEDVHPTLYISNYVTGTHPGAGRMYMSRYLPK